MRTLPRLAKIIGWLLLGISISACSTIKLGYNNVAELGYWWIDGYVDFSSGQTPLAREELAKLHQWHRGTELPRVVNLLKRLEALASADVNQDQVCTAFSDIRERITALTQQALPAVAGMAVGLEPRQIAYTEQKLAKTREQYRKDWLESRREVRDEKRYTTWLDRIESIYGRLDDGQRDTLRKQVALSSFVPPTGFAQMQRRHDDLLQTLRAVVTQPATNATQAQPIIQAYVQRAQASPIAQHRQHQEQLIQESCRTLMVVHNSTTATQRESAVRRLQAYQRDLQELSAAR